jgi:cystathionine beta-synthase
MLDTEIRTLRDISDVKKAKGIEEITSVKETDKVKDVLELITKTGYSQIPVMSGKKSIGSIKESKLLGKLVDNPQLYSSLIKDIMDESFPMLDAKTNLKEVKNILKTNQAVLVNDFGLVTDIITRYDLINFDKKE